MDGIIRFACDQNEYTRRVIVRSVESVNLLYWEEPIGQIYVGSPYYIERVFSEITMHGEWYYDIETGYLYYHFGESSPENVLIEVSRRDNGFSLLNADYVRILRFDVRHGNATFGMGGGIYLENSSNCSIKYNKVSQAFSDGILLLHNSDENLITENDISFNGRGGIYLYSSSDEGPRANTISENEISYSGTNSYDGTGITVVNGAFNVISNNLVYQNGGPAIALNLAGCKRNIITANEVYDNSLTSSDRAAISVFKSSGLDLVKSNLVVDTWGWDELQQKYWGCGIIIDYADYTFVIDNKCIGNNAYGINAHESAHSVIVGNTCCYNGYLNWHSQFVNNHPLSENNMFINNIGYSDTVTLAFSVNSGAEDTPGNIYDFNCWYKDGTEDLIRWGVESYTFEEYTSLTGQDGHSINEDPMLVDVAAGDFRITADSPCIDAGYDFGLPYNGDKPDIGAYEFGWQAPVLAPVGDQYGYPTSLIPIQLDATDPDGDALFYFASGMPENSKINRNTGFCLWRPGAEEIGKTWTVTFLVTDKVNYDLEVVTFKVLDPTDFREDKIIADSSD